MYSNEIIRKLVLDPEVQGNDLRVALLCGQHPASQAEIISITNMNKVTISACCKKLVEAGYLIKHGNRKNAVYSLASDLVDSDDNEQDGAAEENLDGISIHLGDKFRLGNHILMCGDATSQGDVSRLMDGEMADAAVIDPPYIRNPYGGTDPLINNRQIGSTFYRAMTACISGVLKDLGHFYIFTNQQSLESILPSVVPPLIRKNILIWQKQLSGKGTYYSNSYEMILLYCKELDTNRQRKKAGGAKTITGKSNILPQKGFPYISPAHRLHPSQKPENLIRYLIENSSDPGDIVLDTFGGSGTTLMACEKSGRRCRMVESQPSFCKIIIDRWEKETGGKAKYLI